jgi:hypothetical protein
MPTAPYHCADGERVPGTTTVIGRFKDSGALMHWAFQQGKSGAERLYDAAEKAADIGTLAHAMVEASIKGEAPESVFNGAAPEDCAKATNAFNEYLEWAAQTDVKIIAQEMHLCQRRISLRRDARRNRHDRQFAVPARLENLERGLSRPCDPISRLSAAVEREPSRTAFDRRELLASVFKELPGF